MLPDKFVIEKNSAEELFCKPFGELEKNPLDQNDMELMIHLLMIASGRFGKRLDIPEEEKPFLYKVMEKRMNVVFNFKIVDPEALMFMSYMSQTPAGVVMYLTYLQYWCKVNDKTEITFAEICEEIFPFGFPAYNDMVEIWDAVKVNSSINEGTDNLLDYPLAIQSIL